MKTKYTPGPWAYEHGNDNIAILEAADSGTDFRFAIAMVLPQSYDSQGLEHMRQQQKANARLIAAAPMLLEALIQLNKDVEQFGLYHPQGGEFWPVSQELANTAIRAATGE